MWISSRQYSAEVRPSAVSSSFGMMVVSTGNGLKRAYFSLKQRISFDRFFHSMDACRSPNSTANGNGNGWALRAIDQGVAGQ